jgi:hypothetical protein
MFHNILFSFNLDSFQPSVIQWKGTPLWNECPAHIWISPFFLAQMKKEGSQLPMNSRLISSPDFTIRQIETATETEAFVHLNAAVFVQMKMSKWLLLAATTTWLQTQTLIPASCAVLSWAIRTWAAILFAKGRYAWNRLVYPRAASVAS